MPARLEDIREYVEGALGLPVAVAWAQAPPPGAVLSPGEAAHAATLTVPARRATWLLGRAALKQVLAALGEPDDTTGIAFPHPRLSLSHSAGTALALGTPERGVAGLGVDLELRRPPRVEAARFFLAASEKAWLAAEPGRDARLLRIWTIKEALYKAYARNRETSFRDYVLDDPEADDGGAVLRGPGIALRYASLAIQGGFVSAARG